MKGTPIKVVAATAMIGLAAACATDAIAPTTRVVDAAAAVSIPSTGLNENVWVCADAPSGSFDFTVTGTITQPAPGNTMNIINAAPTIAAGNCTQVASAGNGNNVTVEGLAATGYVFDHIEAFYIALNSSTLVADGTTTSPTITRSYGDLGRVFVFFYTEDPVEEQGGRMTGGGVQIVDGVRISRGFTIHCDIVLSNNLEINWKDNKWHIDKPLTKATCLDDPAYTEQPPVAPFNTFIGEGIGRLNGVDGSLVKFTFIDAGEPGTNDKASIQIWAPNGTLVLDIPLVLLNHGNIQAHYDQPHGQKPTK